jgi:hypothetical protein
LVTDPIDTAGMSKDILFLLRHDFVDGPEPRYYCPECSEVNGVLHYYPQLRHHLDVRYVDFARPRPEVIALLGEANQSCPVLVLGAGAPADIEDSELAPDGVHRFVSGARDIGNYLSRRYGIGRPH